MMSMSMSISIRMQTSKVLFFTYWAMQVIHTFSEVQLYKQR